MFFIGEIFYFGNDLNIWYIVVVCCFICLFNNVIFLEKEGFLIVILVSICGKIFNEIFIIFLVFVICFVMEVGVFN